MSIANLPESKPAIPPITDSIKCPYCSSKNYSRRGFRKKALENVQLYICNLCKRTFTPNITKGRRYPLEIIFDAISLYNRGFSLEKSCEICSRKYKLENSTISPATLSKWIKQFSHYLKYTSRFREFSAKTYSPQDIVITATLAHRQLYRFRYHRAKCDYMIKEEYQHRKFYPLKEFLELVPSECPHQYFQKGLRMSEVPLKFSKKEMIVRSKTNYANELCKFVIQSVKERKFRHNALQKYFLYNDSVTVATEVPVYLTREDLEHMKTQLGFEIYRSAADVARPLESQSQSPIDNLPRLITGHIDMLQIRNGQIHLLDYKPNASKTQPIEQLTLYAMALSRLTGLRLFEFKCAWFDEEDYFEFYPLHVLYKPRKARRRKKIETMEGVYKVNKQESKVASVRPQNPVAASF